jgi:maltose alpha-D-glucosyltransferase/alpha-amylase
LDDDRRRIELLNALLFTLPGSPIIYYGDEIGMGDNIWLEDRNGVRTPMQWSGDKNAGFSTAPAEKLYAPVIDDPVYGYQVRNVEQQRTDPHSLFNTLKHMIAVRKQHPVFGTGHFEFWLPDNKAILAYWRANAQERVLVVVNLSDQPQTVRFDFAEPPVDLLTGKPFDTNAPLSAYAYQWLKVW